VRGEPRVVRSGHRDDEPGRRHRRWSSPSRSWPTCAAPRRPPSSVAR
jgi:hypothetical protein